ncbi:hypothetical protein AC579_1427 [Pseudocercospora musae]|uniref:Uncharacterized protein n=1 Tax=Pseudocercospora musae TaxID=113226 RepID=A0A139IMG7_9PEZI|nr:hypothetical protein AC579_1427 [Pseudocercospora musae]
MGASEMSKSAVRVRAFAPKTKTGCKTCSVTRTEMSAATAGNAHLLAETASGTRQSMARQPVAQPPLACNIRYTNGELSGVGHGLALGTELLSFIYMAGLKSRSSNTRKQAIQLLQFANNKTTPYHADIWPRFMMRAAKQEERLAKYLGKDSLPEAYNTIPENPRLSDIVFAQVPYQPRGVNMICIRYTFKDGAPTAIEA